MRISLTHRNGADGTDVKSPAENVIDSFGGLTKLARVLDCPVSTVQGWKERGKIPQDRWLQIIEAGKPLGICLVFDDFLLAQPAPEQAA